MTCSSTGRTTRPPRSSRCISRASATPCVSGASPGGWRAGSPCWRSKVAPPLRAHVQPPPTRRRSRARTRPSMRSSTRPASCARRRCPSSSTPLPCSRRNRSRAAPTLPSSRMREGSGSSLPTRAPARVSCCPSPRVRRPRRCGRSCRPRAAAPIPSTCSARRPPRRSRPYCRSSSQMLLSMPSACSSSARCSPRRRMSGTRSTAPPAWQDEPSPWSQCCSRMRARTPLSRSANVSTFASPESAAAALGVAARRAAWLRRREGVVPTLTGVDRAAARAVGRECAARHGRGVARRPGRAGGCSRPTASRSPPRYVAQTPDDAVRGSRVARRSGRGQVGDRRRAQDRDRWRGTRPARRAPPCEPRPRASGEACSCSRCSRAPS